MTQLYSGERSTRQSRQLLRLARVIFELARSDHGEEWSKALEDLALKAHPLLDSADPRLHPDLGGELLDYTRFIHDQYGPMRNGPGEGEVRAQWRYVDEMLQEIDHRLEGRLSE
jgi:hypothetical protein